MKTNHNQYVSTPNWFSSVKEEVKQTKPVIQQNVYYGSGSNSNNNGISSLSIYNKAVYKEDTLQLSDLSIMGYAVIAIQKEEENNAGELTVNDAWSSSLFIPVVGGSEITINTSYDSTFTYGIAFYDVQKKYISGNHTVQELIQTVIVPTNAVYFRICALSVYEEFNVKYQGLSNYSYKQLTNIYGKGLDPFTSIDDSFEYLYSSTFTLDKISFVADYPLKLEIDSDNNIHFNINDLLLSGVFVTTSEEEQDIDGIKIFKNGLGIGDFLLIPDKTNNSIKLIHKNELIEKESNTYFGNMYVTGWFSALGMSPGGIGPSFGGSNNLFELNDVSTVYNEQGIPYAVLGTTGENTVGKVLTWDGSKWYADEVLNSIKGDERYLLKKIFSKIFTAYNEKGEIIDITDYNSIIDNVSINYSLWSTGFISAYGMSKGDPNPTALYQLTDVLSENNEVQGAAIGSVLTYNGTHWYASKLDIDSSIDTDDILDILDQYDYLTKDEAGDAYLLKQVFKNIFTAYDADDNEVDICDISANINNIKINYGFWSNSFISALGKQLTEPSSTTALYQLVDVLANETNTGVKYAKKGSVLTFDGTHWIAGVVNTNGGIIDEAAIMKIIERYNYLDQTAGDKRYLLNDLFLKIFTAYDEQGNKVDLSSDVIDNIKVNYNFWSDGYLSSRGISDDIINAIDFIEVDEKTISKQNGYLEVIGGVGNGITDAYTKAEVDALLSKKWTQNDIQITNWNTAFEWGNHASAGYLKKEAIYDESIGCWKLKGDLLVTGGITMYANDGSYTPSTITDAVNIDNVTIIRQNGKLMVNPELTIGGGGEITTVAWSSVTGKPTWITETKPEYKFTELKERPTNIGGYGITDAKISNGVITLGGNTITPLTQTSGDARYITSLGVSGNYLTWTKNGTTEKLTIPYASTAKELSTWKVMTITKTNDSGTVYKLIANLTNWKKGYDGQWGMIGVMYGHRGGNMSGTCVQNIVAYCASYSSSGGGTNYEIKTDVTSYVKPVIVSYNGVTYLALRMTGSGSAREHVFMGYTENLLTDFIEVNESNATLLYDTELMLMSGVHAKQATNDGDGKEISSTYLKLEGGTMTGGLVSQAIYPSATNTYALGTSSNVWSNVYTKKIDLDGLGLKKSQNDVLYIDANLVVRGGITMYGTDGTTASTIWDNAPKATTTNSANGKGIASFDSNYFSVSNGHVTFIGSTGGGLDETELKNYLNTNNYLTKSVGDSSYLGINNTAKKATELTNFNVVKFTKTDNSGYPCYLLISDVTTWYNASANQAKWGIVGYMYGSRGGNLSGTCSQKIVALCSYNNANYRLQTDIKTFVAPKIVKYNSKYYLALYMQGSGRDHYFIGEVNNLLDSPINLNCTSSGTYSGLTVVFDTEQMSLNGVNAATATKATYDDDGNNIVNTYLTKTSAASTYLGISAKAASASSADSATTASKLSTTSKKAWGQTYWTSGGVPTDVSGDLKLGSSSLLFDSSNSYGDSSWAIFAYGSTLQFKYGVSSSSPNSMGFQISNEGAVKVFGDITANAHNGRSIGTYGTSFLKTHSNYLTSGASNNNLMLVGGSSGSYGILFALNADGSNSGHKMAMGSNRLYPYTSLGMSLGSSYYLWNGVYLGYNNSSAYNDNGIMFGDGYGRIGCDNGGGIGILASGAIYLRTSNPKSGSISSKGADIDTSGNMGVTGAITASGAFKVSNASAYDLDSYLVYIKANSSAPGIGFASDNYKWYMQVYNDYMYVGRGTTYSFRIDTSGNCLSVGGITMYSDERKKTILNHVELSLKEVADAPIIEHYYNSDEKKTTHVGSIAQYWAGLNDWFCKEDGEGFLTMEIQNAALASAISVARELMRYESKTDKQIRLLKKRICELEDEIETLKCK